MADGDWVSRRGQSQGELGGMTSPRMSVADDVRARLAGASRLHFAWIKARLATRWRGLAARICATSSTAKLALLALGVAPAIAVWLSVTWANSTASSAPTSLARPTSEAAVLVEPSPDVALELELAQAHAKESPTATLPSHEREDLADGLIAEVEGWPLVTGESERQPESVALPPEAVQAEPSEVHVVAEGETLLEIAIAWGVDPDDLAEINDLADRDWLTVGQRLLIPTGGREQVRAVVSSRGSAPGPRFIWPLRGNITTYFGERGWLWVGGYHTGLDIAGSHGDPVRASESGTVLEAGWAETRGYGRYVKIDHGQGYQTLYAHLSTIRVEEGQKVSRGEHLGDVGSTGVSTGPHLHFELRLYGRPVDPLAHLP
mgnify:CR=1 FL=1